LYILALRELADKAFGENTQVDNLILDQFQSGVHEYIKNALAIVYFVDLNDLVQKARRIEVGKCE